MLKLVIANKLYSSWSLRPWMVMRAFDIPFEEIIVPLRTPESKALLAQYSPSGKVPALIDGAETIWESMAIIEYLAESFPAKAIWPKDKMWPAPRLLCNPMQQHFFLPDGRAIRTVLVISDLLFTMFWTILSRIRAFCDILSRKWNI